MFLEVPGGEIAKEHRETLTVNGGLLLQVGGAYWLKGQPSTPIAWLSVALLSNTRREVRHTHVPFWLCVNVSPPYPFPLNLTLDYLHLNSFPSLSVWSPLSFDLPYPHGTILFNSLSFLFLFPSLPPLPPPPFPQLPRRIGYDISCTCTKLEKLTECKFNE